MSKPTSDIRKCTIGEWMRAGPVAIAGGATGVEITDRSPLEDTDSLSVTPEYFWQYGWRWLATDEPASRWTLPEAVFRAMPPCPRADIEAERRREIFGPCPRWPTLESAMAALNNGAYRWAKKEARKLASSRNPTS